MTGKQPVGSPRTKWSVKLQLTKVDFDVALAGRLTKYEYGARTQHSMGGRAEYFWSCIAATLARPFNPRSLRTRQVRWLSRHPSREMRFEPGAL